MSREMLLVILGAGLATYCTRFPLLLIADKRRMPQGLAKFMSFIAPAVLTALIVPAIFIRQGNIYISLNNDYLLSAIVTVLAAYSSRNMFITVVTGLCAVALFVFVF